MKRLKVILAVVIAVAFVGCASAKQDGASFATAVVLDVKRQADSPTAEWAWIEKNFPGARAAQQRRSTEKKEEVVSFGHALLVHDGKSYDALTVELPDRTERTFYFDISGSFGR